MNKNKYLSILVGLLVLLNIVVLGYIFLNNPHKPKSPPDRHPMEKDLLARLNLKADQIKILENSKDQYIEQSRQLNEKLNETSIRYYNANIEDSIRIELHDEILDLTDKIYQVNLKHFDELRSLCSPDQIEIMEEFIEALIRRKRHRHPRRKRK